MRIHRSYLLNLDRLARVEGSTTGVFTAVLIDEAFPSAARARSVSARSSGPGDDPAPPRRPR